MDLSRFDTSVYDAPYVVKDGCLYEITVVKEQAVPVKLADFVPVLTAEITYDDGTEQNKLFRISAVHKSGVIMPEATVSAEEMQSMKWMLSRWGKLGSAQPKHNVLSKIRHAIMSTLGEIRFETVHQQTGWKKINDEYLFLMPGMQNNLAVDLQGKLKNYSFTSCSPHDVNFLSAMLENSFVPQKVMLPMLALTFLCPLNHFLKAGGYEPKFVTALIGRTGSRKSTLAALFLSFFGRFSSAELPMSFHDTANSILANIYYLKDVLTCIDDFHPSGTFNEQNMKETAQNISRYYGDRIGRARLNTKAELMPNKPPTGNAIITAEYVPELSVSGNARYFNIELNENDIVLDKLSEYQKLASEGVLSGIIQIYTEWIKKSFLHDENKFVSSLADLFLKQRNDYLSRLSESKIAFHNRTPDMLAHLKIGFVFLMKFLYAHQQLEDNKMKTLNSVFDEIVLKSVADNSDMQNSESPVFRFCEKLRSLLDSGRCYTETRGITGEPRRNNCKPCCYLILLLFQQFLFCRKCLIAFCYHPFSQC